MIGISKEEQLKKNKKAKPSMKNKPKILDEDRDYLKWLQESYYPRCYICYTQKNIEFHHVKKHSSDRKNHKLLIPLCLEHHRNSNELSVHGTPRKFQRLYPISEQIERAKEIYKEYKDDDIR